LRILDSYAGPKIVCTVTFCTLASTVIGVELAGADVIMSIGVVAKNAAIFRHT